MDQRSDAALVLAAQTGNKAAFGELVERHLPLARRAAMRMLGDQELVADMAQEALLQAYLSLGRLREPARFPSWLYGITLNVCRAYLRSRQADFYSLEALTGGAQAVDTLRLDPAFEPQAVVEQQEQAALVQTALTALSAKNQAATRLFYYEALSIDEIATTLGASANAIKNRLHQSRKQLREQLAPLLTPVQTIAASPIMRTVETHIHAEGKVTMIKITTVQVVKANENGHHILYLLDTVGHRYLRFWVGAHEGEQIRLRLQNDVTARSLTYHYIADLLTALEIKLEEVRIERLQSHVFYAIAKFRNGEIVRELDARPSDAIAVALHTQSPIWVEEKLMAEVGKQLPDPFDAQSWFQTQDALASQGFQNAVAWKGKIVQESDQVFTQRARTMLQRAIAKARELRHNFVGTEHLLWSLASDQEGIAGDTLKEANVTPERIVAALTRRSTPGEFPLVDEPAIVPRVAKVLDLATVARDKNNHPYIGTEHLLWAIIQEGQGMAVTLLRDLGAAPEQVAAKLQKFVPIIE